MSRSSGRSGDGDTSSDMLWEDGERLFCRRWRMYASGGGQAVLVVRPVAEHPTPGSLNRLTHEYQLKEHLDDAWAARPLELVRERGQTTLVLKDPGGEPLDRLIGPPMEIGTFLRLAVAVSAVLGRLHERGLVHKDIKPTNVLVNSATGQAWLTGFGIASRLPRERPSPDPPSSSLEPSLTWRRNRPGG